MTEKLRTTEREEVLEARLVKECKKRGILCLKLSAIKGIPDRLILVKGHHMWVELKTHIGSVTPEQRVWHSYLRKNGAHVIIARGNHGVTDVIAEIDGRLAETHAADFA